MYTTTLWHLAVLQYARESFMSFLFTQRGLKTPVKSAETDQFIQLHQRRCDMYVNPYKSSEALQFSSIGIKKRDGEQRKMQKISWKDLPQSPSLNVSALRERTWICVMKRLHVKCRFFSFFCMRAFSTAKDLGSNQESLDPLSYRCVCVR